jgi:hypothetical protein
MHRRRALVAAFIFLILLLSSAQRAYSFSSSQVRQEIGQAYASVLDAEQKGGNVTGLVSQLNEAITLLNQGDAANKTNPSLAQQLYSSAFSIASNVIQLSPGVASAGVASRSLSLEIFASETAVLGILAFLAYLLTPRVFWSAWVRARRGWRVRKA